MKTLEQAQTLQENVVSSLWISKVSGKRHDHTLAKIKTHISNPTELKYINKQNKAIPYIELTEEQALKFFKTFVEDDIQLKLINSLRAFKGLELLTELEAEEGEIRNKIIKVDNDLTIFEDIEEPLVSHKVIAEQIFEYDKKSVSTKENQYKRKEKEIRELIDKYKSDFQEMSDDNTVKFRLESVTKSNALREPIETATLGELNKEKTYFLNEGQATLLFTYFRNTPKVRQFKKALVKEFLRMRDYIKNDVKQLKERLKQTEELLEDKSLRLNVAEEVLEVNTNRYDKNDEFMTVRYFLNTHKELKKKFTERNLLQELVKMGYAEEIKVTTITRKAIPTKYSKFAPPNEETNTHSSLFTKNILNESVVNAIKHNNYRLTEYKEKPNGLEMYYSDKVNEIAKYKLPNNKKYLKGKDI
jgi:phage regulator Rha-like protein